MCLACDINQNTHGKEAIRKVFNEDKELAKILNTSVENIRSLSKFTGNILHTPDNKRINLTQRQVNEIINHALVIVHTGVDTQIDIWGIQWPTDYIVKTIIF